MPVRKKAAAYHGVQNMKFAPKKAGAYTQPFDMLYAQGISLNAQVSPTEQYADNRLVCRIPSDTGYDGEVGTTAQDPELEKAAGFAIEGASGLITGNVTAYLRGALYYEHLETDEDGANSVVKTWLLAEDPRAPKGGEPGYEDFDEYDVLAVMAAARMDMALIYELPILHLAGIAARCFQLQDPERTERRPMTREERNMFYPRRKKR